MTLTGKCKNDFIEFLLNTDCKYSLNIEEGQLVSDAFFECPLSMQYGVYIDFFDSVKIMIELQVHVSPTMQGGSFKCIRPSILSDGRVHNVGASFRVRERARFAAIKKANEIYNAQ